MLTVQQSKSLSLIFIGVFTLTTFAQNDNNELVWVKKGKTTIGNEEEVDAQPTFVAKVDGFWMQKHEVTNAEFVKFVIATNYKTLAEKNGGSYVFQAEEGIDSLSIPDSPWWVFVEEANWKQPFGENSTLRGKEQYPVVHIAHQDATAYCQWKKMRLPTEVEWEYASRLNGEIELFNHWQGTFPDTNLITDSYFYSAPVESFEPGNLGIYDLQGNVWEWCLDPYHQNAYEYAKKWGGESNKPLVEKYYDEYSPYEETKVIRGGSFLCAEGSCQGYKLGRRMRSLVNMTFQHIGFRCVKEK